MPMPGKPSYSLPTASIGSPAPLPQLCSGEESWRKKECNATGEFSRAFSKSQAATTPREVEKNGPAQRDSNSRGASEDDGTSGVADRALCRTQRGSSRRARGTRQDSGG